jgi:hypothetical protein
LYNVELVKTRRNNTFISLFCPVSDHNHRSQYKKRSRSERMCAGPQETAGQIAPELNEFERQGIQFRVITEDMIPVCLDFLWEQFAPQVL